jgi:hypothetical protein
MVINLREPVVMPPDEQPDPEKAYRSSLASGWPEEAAAAWAAWTIQLPTATEGAPLPWSMREVRQLRFLRAIYEAGGFVGDREDGGPDR